MNAVLNFDLASFEFAFCVELWNRHCVTYMYQQASVGSVDITMLFSSITNCISTFASNISIPSVIFHVSEFYFQNSLARLKFVKIRGFCEFIKFIKFAFAIYGSGQICARAHLVRRHAC